MTLRVPKEIASRAIEAGIEIALVNERGEVIEIEP
jgi:hypothetical protein